MNYVVRELEQFSGDLKHKEGMTCDLDHTDAIADTYIMVDQWLELWGANSTTGQELEDHVNSELRRYKSLIDSNDYIRTSYSLGYLKHRILFLSYISNLLRGNK